MRPLEYIMSITQSQIMKPADPSQNIKLAQQTQMMIDEHIKNNESVTKISDEVNTESMAHINDGMNHSSQNFSHHKNHDHNNHSNEQDVPDKGMLDKNNGKNLDIFC